MLRLIETLLNGASKHDPYDGKTNLHHINLKWNMLHDCPTLPLPRHPAVEALSARERQRVVFALKGEGLRFDTQAESLA